MSDVFILAIARIDRMGQTRPTGGMAFCCGIVLYSQLITVCTVYCYYAEGSSPFESVVLLVLIGGLDTVEKNILDLAARQGLSLYTKENAAGTLNISALDNDSSKKTIRTRKKVQKGDFIFR